MAWYAAVVAHGVALLIECYFAVVRLQVVVEAFGIFRLFSGAQGGLVFGEVLSVEVGVSTSSASTAAPSMRAAFWAAISGSGGCVFLNFLLFVLVGRFHVHVDA